MHSKSQLNQQQLFGCHFRSYKSKNSKTKMKNIYLKYFGVFGHVCETIRPMFASILLFERGKYSKIKKMPKTVNIFAILVTSRIEFVKL